jgi:hypothetical protein
MKKTFFILGASLGLAVILSGCQFSPSNTPTENTETENTSGAGQAIGMANPASVNCTEKGGTLQIRQNKNGQYGICFFEDNRQCEEWALFRNECPVGGMKVTGYENEAQIYCAITGGIVEGVGTESVMCKRIDGTYCQVDANFNGECPDPHDPNPNSGNGEDLSAVDTDWVIGKLTRELRNHGFFIQEIDSQEIGYPPTKAAGFVDSDVSILIYDNNHEVYGNTKEFNEAISRYSTDLYYGEIILSEKTVYPNFLLQYTNKNVMVNSGAMKREYFFTLPGKKMVKVKVSFPVDPEMDAKSKERIDTKVAKINEILLSEW